MPICRYASFSIWYFALKIWHLVCPLNSIINLLLCNNEFSKTMLAQFQTKKILSVINFILMKQEWLRLVSRLLSEFLFLELIIFSWGCSRGWLKGWLTFLWAISSLQDLTSSLLNTPNVNEIWNSVSEEYLLKMAGGWHS